jgi:hypothetical protein
MEGIIVRNPIVAAAIALTLASFAAIGAVASQESGMFRSLSGGVLSADTTPTDTATATNTPAVDVPTATDTPEATETPSATDTPQATDTPSPTSTSQAEATATPSPEATATGGDKDDNHDRDVKGVPTSNPAHHPGDDDGNCDKGETEVKTTPSGTQVDVPCQAAGDHHGQTGGGERNGSRHGGGDDGDD